MLTSYTPHDFQDDLDLIAAIPAVPNILEVVCRTTGMRFAAVARVTDKRWVCCASRDDLAFGLVPGGELAVETTICDEIRDSTTGVVIDHVAMDPVFHNHHTPAKYGFQSYISMPILLADGSFYGTLCSIDPQPNSLNNPAVVGLYKLFAELIAFHIDAYRKVKASEAMLLTERQGTELREQFIAVLGHDLRNPLAALDAGTRLLQKTEKTPRETMILTQMQASIHRMSGLITNVLDFARGRLGGGLTLERTPVRLEPMLDLVTAELQAVTPQRRIETDFSTLGVVDCDPARLGQMLSNLVGNAVTHGAAEAPVHVLAASHGDAFILEVRNQGPPIPPTTIEHLFKPFFRVAEGNRQGLGLGLYIASEIARAHGGTLTAASADGETCFTFRMPLTPS